MSTSSDQPEKNKNAKILAGYESTSIADFYRYGMRLDLAHGNKIDVPNYQGTGLESSENHGKYGFTQPNTPSIEQRYLSSDNKQVRQDAYENIVNNYGGGKKETFKDKMQDGINDIMIKTKEFIKKPTKDSLPGQ